MSTVLQTIGVNNLALRGGSTTFNRLDRFFNNVAEAEAAAEATRPVDPDRQSRPAHSQAPQAHR